MEVDTMSIGHSDGRFDPAFIRVFGLKVALRKEDRNEEIVQDGIILPESTLAGVKGTTATVIAIGDDASEATGVKVGDQVRYDQCSVYHDTHPVVIINCENIIVKLIEGEDIPLKNHVFVRKVGTIFNLFNPDVPVPPVNTLTAYGEIFKTDNDDIVSVGEKILMTTKCDVINKSEGKIYIYNHHNILLVFDEKDTDKAV